MVREVNKNRSNVLESKHYCSTPTEHRDSCNGAKNDFMLGGIEIFSMNVLPTLLHILMEMAFRFFLLMKS